jgi:hypothetical protein
MAAVDIRSLTPSSSYFEWKVTADVVVLQSGLGRGHKGIIYSILNGKSRGKRPLPSPRCYVLRNVTKDLALGKLL